MTELVLAIYGRNLSHLLAAIYVVNADENVKLMKLPKVKKFHYHQSLYIFRYLTWRVNYSFTRKLQLSTPHISFNKTFSNTYWGLLLMKLEWGLCLVIFLCVRLGIPNLTLSVVSHVKAHLISAQWVINHVCVYFESTQAHHGCRFIKIIEYCTSDAH